MTKPDPETIWLQNAEDAKHQSEGRLWCEDRVWPTGNDPEEGEPTEYIRADIHARALLEAERRGRNAGLDDAAEIARQLLVFADTTSGADQHIPDAIRAAAKEIEP